MAAVYQSQPVIPTHTASYSSPMSRPGGRALPSNIYSTTPFPTTPSTLSLPFASSGPGPMPSPFLPHPNRNLPSLSSSSTSTSTSSGTHTSSSFSPMPILAPRRDKHRHASNRIAVDEVDLKAEEPQRFGHGLGHRHTDFGPKELDLDRSLGMGVSYDVGISTPNSKNANVKFSRLPPDYIPASPELGTRSRRRANSLSPMYTGRGRELDEELTRGRTTSIHHRHDYDGERERASRALTPTSSQRHSHHHRGAMIDLGNGEAIPIPSHTLGHGHTFVGAQPAIGAPAEPRAIERGSRSESRHRSRSRSRPRSPHRHHHHHRSNHQHGQPRVSVSPSPHPVYRYADTTGPATHTSRPGYTRHRSRSLGALAPRSAVPNPSPRGPVYTVQLPPPPTSAPLPGQGQGLMSAPGPMPIHLPTRGGQQQQQQQQHHPHRNHEYDYIYSSTTYPHQRGRYTSMQGQGQGQAYGGLYPSSHSHSHSRSPSGSGSNSKLPTSAHDHAHDHNHDHEHEHGFLTRLFGHREKDHKSGLHPHPHPHRPHHAPGAGPGLAAGIGSGKGAVFAPQPPGYPQTQPQMNYPQTHTNYPQPQMPTSASASMQNYGGMGKEGHRYGFGGSWGLRHHHQPVASIPPPPAQGPLPTRRAARRGSF